MNDIFQMGAIDFHKFYDPAACESIMGKHNLPSNKNYLSQMKTIGGALGFQFREPEEDQTVGYSRLKKGFTLMLFNGSNSVDLDESVQLLDELCESGVIKQYVLHSEHGIVVS